MLSTQLRREAEVLQSHWLAESSWQTRRSQWRHYRNFCDSIQVNPLSPSQHVLCLYIAFMARSFRYVSIINYISAVRGLQKWDGITPVPVDNFLVKATLIGARRLLGDTSFSSDPLLPSQLHRIHAILDMNNPSDFMFWAATVVAFRGLLRKSSICKGQHCIRRKDVSFHSWGVVISLHSSKTIQFQDRVHKIPLAKVSGPLCAVSLLEQLYRTISASAESPLFGVFNRNCYVPLDYRWYTKRLAICVKATGLNKEGKYTSHSLRRGGATALAMIGVPLHDIQRRGDWKSLSVLLYLSSPLQYRVDKEKALAQDMVTTRH